MFFVWLYWHTVRNPISWNFLPEGSTWKMVSYEDGVNANKQAMHYMKREQQVKKGQTIRVKMARNGGFAAVLSFK